jgi:uncharacterized phage infection (PIP) family protein YhgE
METLFNTKRKFILITAALLLLIAAVLITSKALGISPISWILNRDKENSDLVVAYVNHDPVHLASLE